LGRLHKQNRIAASPGDFYRRNIGWRIFARDPIPIEPDRTWTHALLV
jgi:hypothetical protein